jgi:hypothetical protein
MIAVSAATAIIALGLDLSAQEPDAAPEAQQVARVQASSGALKEIERTAKDLRDVARSESRDRARRAPPLTVEEVLAKTGKKNPQKIFEWVRDEITFEPYAGTLRDPETVLAARSGNAADTARLLHALYSGAGMKVRYVWGSLDDANASGLLERFTGEVIIERNGAPVHDASYDVFPPLVVAQASAHAWVEVEDEGRYKDADPLTGLEFETTRGKREGFGDALPSSFETRLELRLVAHRKDGREFDLIKARGSIDEFTSRPLSLTFTRDARVPDGYRPVLQVGSKSQRASEYFSASDLASLELTFDLQVSARRRVWAQPLYQVEKGQNPFDYEQLHLSMAVISGWTSDAQLARVGGQTLGDTMSGAMDWSKSRRKETGPQIDSAFENATTALIEQSVRVFPYVYARHLDRLSLELAGALGVKPVMYQPRIFVTSVVRDRDTIHMQTAIQGERLEALAALGVPQVNATAFGVLYGRFADEVRGSLIESLVGEKPMTTTAVFDSAIAGKIPVYTLHRGDLSAAKKIKKPEGVSAYLAKKVKKSGVVVLVPSRPVTIGAQERTSWWEVDPVTNQLHGGSWQGLFNISNTPASKAPIDQGAIMLALTTMASKQLSLWMSALSSSGGFEHTLCMASKDTRTIGRALCAKRAARELPGLASCLLPEYKEADASPKAAVDPLDPMGMGGGEKFGAPGCDDTVVPLRCGAVVANAFLEGELVAIPKLPEDKLADWRPFVCGK